MLWSFTRNPASHILTETRDNDLYVWGGQPGTAETTDYAVNGLNQYAAVKNNAYIYDR